MLNGVSISVSEDDGDAARRTRARARYKRKNPWPGGRREFLRRVARTAIRWWPVLLFLPAFVLLLEMSRIGKNLPDENRPDLTASAKEEESPRNLNRLDPMTRVVHGVREPCLKILNPEQIENLELPASAEVAIPAKRVLYKVDSGEHHVEGNVTFPQKNGTARFNLFTGYQTLDEREQSFK